MESPAPVYESRLLIQRELVRRCERNPRYSLRAFAKAIGVSHPLLSLVLSGKRELSHKAAMKIVERLELTSKERNDFLERTKKRKKASSNKAGPENVREDFHQISLDVFSLLSDWYHYAILSLLEIQNSRFEARWIAPRLGISEIQAKDAIERLKRLHLVSRIGKRWKQTGLPLKVDNAISTAATRKFHRQLLEKALDALENEPFERREFYSITTAINPKVVPNARRRIKSFGRQLVKEMEEEGPAREVYHLTIQLFPVTRLGASA